MLNASEIEESAGGGVRPHAVAVDGVTRRFGEVTALASVSLAVREGEFFSLLGPSGCGKTTLLRIIAGLEHPDAGSLKLGGKDAAGIPAHKRSVNTVFQSYALFPHMTVKQNISFGLRMRKSAPEEIAAKVEKMMALVEIHGLGARRPAQLSGGQKQRVALARALVNEPSVLLLDEPLGALDLKLRKQLQAELHELQRRLGTTFIYVTHDQEEALVMSDRVAVMNEGQIEQLDTPENLYERPQRKFVAQFLGSCNLLKGTVRESGRSSRIETGVGTLQVDTVERNGLSGGDNVTLAVRPEKIQLSRPGTPGEGNCVSAIIADLVYSGAETQYSLRSGSCCFKAVALNSKVGHQGFRPGETVSCHISPQALLLLED